MQVTAILSDYDGTLCSTASLRTKDNRIPKELEKILWSLSGKIPTCIISSKDFSFLHERTKFGHILSCVLGIETVVHNSHCDNDKVNSFDCIKTQHLISSRQSLLDNSKLLYHVMEILQNYKDTTIEEKYTSDKKTLIGLTIDYRHLENWQSFKADKEPILREMIQRNIDDANLASYLSSKDRPFIQIYSSHPFLDVYGIEYDKGLAFDNVLLHLDQKEREANVMYLGDSENDNPAFRKSDISIGIRSDKRLNPKLDCDYMLDFTQLPLFLKVLMDNDLVFSRELLPSQTK